MDEGSTPYNQDSYAPISIHDVYGKSDYNSQNNFRVFGIYQPTFFHESWLHAVADGWSLGGTYDYHTGFPWTPTYSVFANGGTTGQAAHLYYQNSPYSTIRPLSYNGTGLASHSLAAFESGPSTSFATNRNSNFPIVPTGQTGGQNYFTPPTYTAVGTNTAFTTTNITPPPGRAIERGLFTGPSFQNFNASITKGFNIPKAKVIGEAARSSSAWTSSMSSTQRIDGTHHHHSLHHFRAEPGRAGLTNGRAAVTLLFLNRVSSRARLAYRARSFYSARSLLPGVFP